MRKSICSIALLALGAASLGACSGSKTPDASATTASAEQAVVETRPLPEVLDNADNMQTIAEALKTTGIASAFAGQASYTLLAPTDDAFAAAGDKAKQILDSDDHAPLAALIRAHMLPGYVTVSDIDNAIDASKDGSVTMPTVSGDQLTFTKAAGQITITTADGTKAHISGDAVSGATSTAIPVDGLLKSLQS